MGKSGETAVRGASSLELVPVNSLIPYAKNARTHSEAQVNQIAASIKEFGFNNPILISDDGTVIAGHGRLLAAQKLNLSKVPTVRLSYLSETERRAYVLADNRLALNAGWDEQMLGLELSDLAGLGIDANLLGFGEDEVAKLMAQLDATSGLTDQDEVPPVEEDPVSKPGDVWVLGRHRLVCGDSTQVETVDKALNGVTPHLMVTDPPYGVEYDPAWRARAGVSLNKKKLGSVSNDDKADWTEAWALFPGDVAYIWHAGRHASEVERSITECGFEIRAQIIWAKDRFALSRGHYHWQHEPCWYAVRKGSSGSWNGDRAQSTLWKIAARDDSGHGHGTQKPVECMKRPIENNSSPGQAVYEPFSGSGTTIIAAEMTGRSCHAIELDPKYVDVAVKRWQNFTGKDATLEATGETFNAASDARS